MRLGPLHKGRALVGDFLAFPDSSFFPQVNLTWLKGIWLKTVLILTFCTIAYVYNTISSDKTQATFARTANPSPADYLEKDYYLPLRQMPQQEPMLNLREISSHIDLPGDATGIIIGKNRHNINSIQKESGAKLLLDRNTRLEGNVRKIVCMLDHARSCWFIETTPVPQMLHGRLCIFLSFQSLCSSISFSFRLG